MANIDPRSGAPPARHCERVGVAETVPGRSVIAFPVRASPVAHAPAVSVVVPMYNERPTLARLLEELVAALDRSGRTWELVLVDDGSTDGSWRELLELKGGRPRVALVRLRRNFGKAAALEAGFRRARGEIVVTMDADLQDDPQEIPRLLAKLDEGYDVVSGWKEHRRDPWSRRVLSRAFNTLTGLLTGLHIRDVNCGLKAYRRQVLAEIRLYGEMHRFIPVLAHHDGFRVTEVAVNHRPRPVGRSRYGLERYLRGFLDLLTVAFFGRFRYRPLHLFGPIGLVTGFAGFVICTYLTGLKLAGEAIGHRPLLILGTLLIVVGVQFLMMGLLAELFLRLTEERRGSATDHVADVA
jgi:glycosyltransferase involved in cell wall biosynthesis